MKKNEVYVKIIGDYILLIIAILFIVFCVPKLILFFMPIVLGYIISLVANPIVRFLEEKIKLVRKHGSALVIFLVIALVSITLYGIVYLIMSQINNIINELPSLFLKIENKINEIGNRFNGIINTMPKNIKRYILTFGNGISFDNNMLSGSSSFKAAKTTIMSVTNMLLYMVFTVMSAYYFTAERDKILCRIRLCLPGYMMSNVRKVIGNFKSILGDYIKVQLKLMIILTVVLYLGLSIFDIKYAFLISVVIGILDVLPFLGTGCVLIPWSIGEFFLNEVVLAIELLVLYIICVTIREVAEPKMFGKRIGISAFATFFLLYIGLELGGIIGVILAIPLGMVLINLYKAGAFEMLIENTKFLYYDIGKSRRQINKYVIKENKKRFDR